jgi:hypothetical protein
MLPSLPVTVNCVALVAVTVNVDELPAEIVMGLAEIFTVAGTFAPVLCTLLHPLNNRESKRPGIPAKTIR